jgi:hypothetical protein
MHIITVQSQVIVNIHPTPSPFFYLVLNNICVLLALAVFLEVKVGSVAA